MTDERKTEFVHIPSTFSQAVLNHGVLPEPVQVHYASRPDSRAWLARNPQLCDDAFAAAYVKKVPAKTAKALTSTRFPTDQSVAAVVDSRERRVTPLEALLRQPLTDKQCLMLADLAMPESVADQVLSPNTMFPLAMQLQLSERGSPSSQFLFLWGRADRMPVDTARQQLQQVLNAYEGGWKRHTIDSGGATWLLYKQPALAHMLLDANAISLLPAFGRLAAPEVLQNLQGHIDAAIEDVPSRKDYLTRSHVSELLTCLLLHPAVSEQDAEKVADAVERYDFVDVKYAARGMYSHRRDERDNEDFGGPFGLPPCPRIGVPVSEMDAGQLQQVLTYLVDSNLVYNSDVGPTRWLLLAVADRIIALDDDVPTRLMAMFFGVCFEHKSATPHFEELDERVSAVSGLGRDDAKKLSDLDVPAGAQVARNRRVSKLNLAEGRPAVPQADPEAGATVEVSNLSELVQGYRREPTQQLHDAVAHLAEQFGADVAQWDMAFAVSDAGFDGTAEQLVLAAAAGTTRS